MNISPKVEDKVAEEKTVVVESAQQIELNVEYDKEVKADPSIAYMGPGPEVSQAKYDELHDIDPLKESESDNIKNDVTSVIQSKNNEDVGISNSDEEKDSENDDASDDLTYAPPNITPT